MTDDRTGLVREETHHRFLNTLTALQLLLRRDFAAFGDPRVQAAVTTFESQLIAFASLHRSLRPSTNGCIDVPTHFAQLCAQLCSAHLAPRGHRCDFSADDGEIESDACEKVGLIVAELMTNCGKHAFPGHAGGRVAVSLRQSGGGWVCVVQDNGCGIRPGHVGEGMRLVQALASTIQADVAFQSDAGGGRVTVRVPGTGLMTAMNRLAAAPPPQAGNAPAGRWP